MFVVAIMVVTAVVPILSVVFSRARMIGWGDRRQDASVTGDRCLIRMLNAASVVTVVMREACKQLQYQGKQP